MSSNSLWSKSPHQQRNYEIVRHLSEGETQRYVASRYAISIERVRQINNHYRRHELGEDIPIQHRGG